MVTMNCVYDGKTDTVANFHSDSKKFSIKLSNLFGQSILTEVGKNLVNTLELSTDFFLLQKELSFVEEMMNLIVRFGTLPIINSSDLAIKIGFAKKGGILTPKDLNDIAEDIETSSKVISFVKKCEGNYYNTKDFIKDTPYFSYKIYINRRCKWF